MGLSSLIPCFFLYGTYYKHDARCCQYKNRIINLDISGMMLYSIIPFIITHRTIPPVSSPCLSPIPLPILNRAVRQLGACVTAGMWNPSNASPPPACPVLCLLARPQNRAGILESFQRPNINDGESLVINADSTGLINITNLPDHEGSPDW